MTVKTLLASLLLSAVTIAALPAASQNILGQSQFQGRTVILNDDFTWSYGEQAASGDTSDCFKVIGPYVFCGKPLGWGATTKLSPDAAASFRLDDRNYLAVIREGLGTNDGFSLDFMQGAMVTNLATAAGLNEQDIPVYSVDDMELFGIPARRVVYGGEISGLPVIYYNTVWVTDVETIQFFTFTIGKEPTESAMTLHNDSVAAIQKLN